MLSKQQDCKSTHIPCYSSQRAQRRGSRKFFSICTKLGNWILWWARSGLVGSMQSARPGWPARSVWHLHRRMVISGPESADPKERVTEVLEFRSRGYYIKEGPISYKKPERQSKPTHPSKYQRYRQHLTIFNVSNTPINARHAKLL